MAITRNTVDPGKFNRGAALPFELRLKDFEIAMQDIYDFFFDVNRGLVDRGLARLDDMLRPAIMSGLLSDMLTSSLAKHSRTLTENRYHNGHPDLVVRGVYPLDSVQAAIEGVEIKTTRKHGGAVDTHGARDQWMCVFVYKVDATSEPARDRSAMSFVEVYLGQVVQADFRKNARGELGTANRHVASGRSGETKTKLDLQSQLLVCPVLVPYQFGDGLFRDVEVVLVFFQTDTRISDVFCGRQRRAGARKWVKYRADSERKYASNDGPQEGLRL
jgi:hypothetical protein